ncbi:MAG TPA: methyltransferase domain-containing protein [Gemmatimonadaceae bacterium]|nr:methyltransferase domain-containing protein [Gemmatimonadaceae bacterium]
MSSGRHNCCESQFDRERAAAELKRYRRKGPDRTTRLLLDALKAAGVRGATVLDVGGGIGAVHHELLEAGAATAVHVDAASAYVEAARQESARRGHDTLVRFLHGDFVHIADSAPDADVVTLDRVICCYPDMRQLVEASASKARRLYGAVYPRDSWLQRLIVRLDNFRRKRRGSDFRTFVHSPRRIDETLRGAGLAPSSIRDTLLWRVAIYARPASH